jgi:hypothetical protein
MRKLWKGTKSSACMFEALDLGIEALARGICDRMSK